MNMFASTSTFLASLLALALLGHAEQLFSFASANADGAPLVIELCGPSPPNQQWSGNFNSPAQPLRVFSDKCIDVPGGINADGQPLQVWSCVQGNTNQMWTTLQGGLFQWSGTNKCIDLTNGNTAPGTVLQLFTCVPNLSQPNQRWRSIGTSSGRELVELTVFGGAFCLTSASGADGAAIATSICSEYTQTLPDGNVVWDVPTTGNSGIITGFGKCLDVQGGIDADGTLLQLFTCVPGNTNQQFIMLSGGQIQWAGTTGGTGKCLDVRNGQQLGGTIQIFECSDRGSNTNQEWFLEKFSIGNP
ncbi:ricin B lectin domain-containing protein [Mycena capillaripes]|nr:ricin B lectin domain-containing protein [Mycena capillaripes]